MKSIYGHLVGFVLGIVGAVIASVVASQGVGGVGAEITSRMAGFGGFVVVMPLDS